MSTSAAFALATSIITAVHASVYPITVDFNPNTPPNEECPNGAPPVQGLPFTDDTPVDDPYIANYTNKLLQCFCDHFLNNVEHMDAAKLYSQIVTDDTKRCIFLSNDTRHCVKMKTRFAQLELISNILDVVSVNYTVSDIRPYSMRINGTMKCRLTARVGGFLIGHNVCFLSLSVYDFAAHLARFTQFTDDFNNTYTFNDDGTWRQWFVHDEQSMASSLEEWADSTLVSGYAAGHEYILDLIERYGDYLKVDHDNKDQYYRLDLGDVSTKVIIGCLVLWFVCAPIGMVWVAMKCFNGKRRHKYGKVNYDSSDIDLKSEDNQLIDVKS